METFLSILWFKFSWEHGPPICFVYERHAATSLHNNSKARAGDVRSPVRHPKLRGMLRSTVAAHKTFYQLNMYPKVLQQMEVAQLNILSTLYPHSSGGFTKSSSIGWLLKC